MSHITPDTKGTVLQDSTPELTRVYADALLGAAEKAGRAEAVVTELEEFHADLWTGQPGFAAMMTSQAVDAAEKDRILGLALDGHADPFVANFLKVVNRHDRMDHLPAIIRGVRNAWERGQNRRFATVRSAVPLDEAQVAALTDRLTAMLGADPILRLEVDPDLVGGLVIQVGDQVIDASVRSQYFKQFRKQLVEDRVHQVLGSRAEFGLT